MNYYNEFDKKAAAWLEEFPETTPLELT